MIENIIKIEEDTKYLKNIQKLVTFYNLNITDEIFCDGSKPIIFNYIDFIKSSNIICSILSYNSDTYGIVGFIKNYTDESIEIMQVDSNSYEDGMVCINLDNIEKIICCSDEEKKLENLYKLNIDTIAK